MIHVIYVPCIAGFDRLLNIAEPAEKRITFNFNNIRST